MALTKISISTWGASFTKSRRVYSAVVRPAMTYGSTIWHTPKDVKKSKTSTSKLSIMQNKCLRTIAGAFKAMPIPVLEAETYIAPIDIHLDHLQAKARYRLRVGGQAKFIAKNCKAIANKLRGKSGRTRAQKPTLGTEKHDWARKLLADAPIISFPDPLPPWTENISHCDKLEVATTAQRKHFQQMKAQHANNWSESWKTYQNSTIEPSIAQKAFLDKKRLKIHTLLKKAESSLATQIRTGKIGLADFLHKHRVPGITSPACPCGWHRQTPEHVIMFCRLIKGRRAMFREAGTNSYQTLTESPKPLKLLTAWLMKSGTLTQFSLAVQLLINSSLAPFLHFSLRVPLFQHLVLRLPLSAGYHGT